MTKSFKRVMVLAACSQMGRKGGDGPRLALKWALLERSGKVDRALELAEKHLCKLADLGDRPAQTWVGILAIERGAWVEVPIR